MTTIKGTDGNDDGREVFKVDPRFADQEPDSAAIDKLLASRREEFRKELGAIINRYSQENGSDTPDFILADYLLNCLDAWNAAVKRRTKWYTPAAQQRIDPRSKSV